MGAILVCSFTENYTQQIKPSLKSVNKNFIGKIYSFTVGFEAPKYIRDEFPNVEFVKITPHQNYGAPERTNSIQHGSFLNLIECDEDDVITYMDGDITMQRKFNQQELDLFRSLTNEDVFVGWNSGPGETLEVEGRRLQPKKPMHQIVSEFGECVLTAGCYNIGVLVARPSVWRKIYKTYLPLYSLAEETFGHMARQQWLACYAFCVNNLNVIPMPYAFHTHAHYGLPKNLTYDKNGVAKVGNKIILFRHKF